MSKQLLGKLCKAVGKRYKCFQLDTLKWDTRSHIDFNREMLAYPNKMYNIETDFHK